MWLWSTLIQEKLDELKEEFNTHKVRYDSKKALPSGVPPNVAMACYEDYPDVKNCLQPVDLSLLAELKELIGGEELLCFMPKEISDRCEMAFEELGISEVTFQNAWDVFLHMLPLVFDKDDENE